MTLSPRAGEREQLGQEISKSALVSVFLTHSLRPSPHVLCFSSVEFPAVLNVSSGAVESEFHAYVQPQSILCYQTSARSSPASHRFC